MGNVFSIYIYRDKETGDVMTNVPRLVIHHSPDGFEYGYDGSGPADLALNILEWRMRERNYDGPTMKVWKGECFRLAFRLHQDFKRHFIATIPRNGDAYMHVDVIDNWIADRVTEINNE